MGAGRELADQALYLAKNGGRNTWAGLLATAQTDPETLSRRLATSPEEAVSDGALEIVRPGERAPVERCVEIWSAAATPPLSSGGHAAAESLRVDSARRGLPLQAHDGRSSRAGVAAINALPGDFADHLRWLAAEHLRQQEGRSQRA